MSATRVRMTVDLHRPGKAVGEILVPISTNESAAVVAHDFVD